MSFLPSDQSQYFANEKHYTNRTLFSALMLTFLKNTSLFLKEIWDFFHLNIFNAKIQLYIIMHLKTVQRGSLGVISGEIIKVGEITNKWQHSYK